MAKAAALEKTEKHCNMSEYLFSWCSSHTGYLEADDQVVIFLILCALQKVAFIFLKISSGFCKSPRTLQLSW